MNRMEDFKLKTTLKRILTLTMALVMVLSFATVAMAKTTDIDAKDNDFGGVSIPSGVEITFAGGEGYALVPNGMSTPTSGDVMILAAGKLDKNQIPSVVEEDAYYKFRNFAVLDADGNLQPIDITNYQFSKNTTVFAVVDDLWVPYNDMKQDRTDWFYKYVRDMSIAGVVNGYPDYTFNPNGNVTWGEALKLIMLAAGYDTQAAVDSHWASGYLAKAKADALVDADAVIDLSKPITRVEYARVAAKALGLAEPKIATPFVDTDDAAVLALFEKNIVEGSFNASGERVFYPDNYITRAEISTIVWRIYHLAN